KNVGDAFKSSPLFKMDPRIKFEDDNEVEIMKVKEKLKALRDLMKKNKIDVYFIPSSDPHQSEYVAKRWQSRIWLSGFTGSAGSIFITMDSACLFTDGRYDIQVEKQLKGSSINFVITNFPNAILYNDWIKGKFKKKKKLSIGFDGKVVSIARARSIENDLKGLKISFNTKDLVDEVWKDRPEIPCKTLFLQNKYTGTTLAQKIAKIREKMVADNANCFIESSLDNIAWTLNVRGNDIPYSPVVISNLIISEKDVYYFVDKKKLCKKTKDYFKANKVTIKDYFAINSFVSKMKKGSKVMLDQGRISKDVFDSISEKAEIAEKNDPIPLMKSIKDKIEIKNMKKAMIKESVVLVKFQIWLEKNLGKKLKELDISAKITELRKEQRGFFSNSFTTISAYKENAALMHYSPEKKTQVTIKKEGLLLVDTGGNYYEGTTDTTRTYALGKLSKEEKKDYTLTLKGHINLVRSLFLKGTTGQALDVLARQPIWNDLYDYKCGTGHGVGAFLNVHEGPQTFSQWPSEVKLEPGMITTVEPGIYKKGKHGIRIENMYLTKKVKETLSGEFYGHECITYVPIDTKPIVMSLMDKAETDWLDKYHAMVYKTLESHLTRQEQTWLK
ncbi:MAG: aminopeptidase P family protein, partial [Candidatus Delongbacteria bacterium]|nr:aminopeptidase P family protein [Candidatus Delongbacteria bacterium]